MGVYQKARRSLHKEKLQNQTGQEVGKIQKSSSQEPRLHLLQLLIVGAKPFILRPESPSREPWHEEHSIVLALVKGAGRGGRILTDDAVMAA